MNLISEFFYEAIRRIIPGLVIIFLYRRHEVENIFHTHQDFFSPYLFGVCVLAAAWLIGILIETTTSSNGPIGLVIKFVRYFVNSSFNIGQTRGIYQIFLSFLDSLLRPSPNSESHEHLSTRVEVNLARELSRINYAFGSTIIMCRCLWIIFLFSIFSIYCHHPPEKFSNLQWKPWFVWAGFIGFFLAWITLKCDEKKL
jgi:hypothetical protein